MLIWGSYGLFLSVTVIKLVGGLEIRYVHGIPARRPVQPIVDFVIIMMSLRRTAFAARFYPQGPELYATERPPFPVVGAD